jgi:two-component system, chemotaxis family, CheB/CheR fusion protein
VFPLKGESPVTKDQKKETKPKKKKRELPGTGSAANASIQAELLLAGPGQSAEDSSGDESKLKAGNRFFISGIGASAGGLEAFEQFFTNMPPDSGIAFVLVPHLSPEHKSMMVDLLKRFTRMQIYEAGEDMKVEPDCIYIIPPDREMSISGGRLQLAKPLERRGLRHPIDSFFRSLAADQGERAIAVIFSGTGTEGTLGLKEIKGANGLVIVQDPDQAKYDGMPRSAIATGLVDYILPVEKMPETMLRHIRHTGTREAVPPGMEEVFPSDLLQKISVLVRSRTGHDFSLYKHKTVTRRIERRMAVLQIDTIDDYFQYLRNHPHEVDTLFRELLIRVTNFFRDQEAFEILKAKALPDIFRERQPDQTVRIWVPGCSTGEEAYSLVMVFQEYMRTLDMKFKIQVFATDIDSSAVEIARAGLYSPNITVDVSAERLADFFIRTENGYRIKDAYREMVVFAIQDLIKDPPFSRLDLISCRNLLIYLSSGLQNKVLPLFRYALNPGGILFLGSSESIGESSDLFSVVDKKWKIYRASKTGKIEFPPLELKSAGLTERIRRHKGPDPKRAEEPNIEKIAGDLLLEHYAPPCAVVDSKGELLYVHGRTGKYLEPASGKASLNIVDMAREGLRTELRIALRQADKQMKDISVTGLNVKTNGDLQTINLEIKYIRKPESLRGLVMVVFRDAQRLETAKSEKKDQKTEGLANESTAELEIELKSTKEHLQTTIEELQASNEELQATNEELQSSNEELQSMNEELETSREEMQSTNEEMLTVNAEFQHKMDELSQVNNDMSNLLASTQIATIFLDMGLLIKRFTPSATKIINIIQTDIGRPLTDIVQKIEYPGLIQDAAEVLKTLEQKENVVRHQNGRWYLARIIPYRTTGNVVAGLVITYIEVTEQRKLQEELEDVLALTKGIVETVHDPLVALDTNLRVLSANKSFYNTFRVSPEETEGKLIYDLGNRQWDIPGLRKLLEEILPLNNSVENFLVEHAFPGIGPKKMLLNARQIEKSKAILLTIADIRGYK